MRDTIEIPDGRYLTWKTRKAITVTVVGQSSSTFESLRKVLTLAGCRGAWDYFQAKDVPEGRAVYFCKRV
jgi:hypothetical protein